ncbi:MAG: DUF362 domain-containing protein [Candidatus Thorarchaeota archaeon]|jgi:uncharacterized protein (DUF362 family)
MNGSTSIPEVSPPYTQDGRFLVSKVSATDDLKQSIKEAVNLIGGFDRIIEASDKVTIKPNLNTADPYPASSDPQFLRALSELLIEAGAGKLRIVDSSMFSLKTCDVADDIGLCSVVEDLGIELVYLDEHEWIKKQFPKGKNMKSGAIGAPTMEGDKLVVVPCLKTHRFARFTATMKSFVGWVGTKDRIRMHARRLEAKIVDLASFFKPDLVVMDARKVFVSGGPAKGQVESPNLILASGDMVSIDVEGVRILKSYDAKNRLSGNIWEIPQIRHAAEIGIGAASDEDILVVS